jgi:hypothetical protein
MFDSILVLLFRKKKKAACEFREKANLGFSRQSMEIQLKYKDLFADPGNSNLTNSINSFKHLNSCSLPLLNKMWFPTFFTVRLQFICTDCIPAQCVSLVLTGTSLVE